MKFVIYGIMVVGSFFLGKIMYGPLKPSLLSEGKVEKAAETIVEVKVSSPLGTVTEKVDLLGVTEMDYPEKVTLRAPMMVSTEDGSDQLELNAGNKVKVLALDGLNLSISALAGPLKGTVKVTDTDFAEGVARKRMDRRLSIVDQAREETAQNNPKPAPNPKPGPAPEPVVAQNDPDQMSPEPAPEPEPEPEPAAPTTLNAEQIVAAMQEHLKAGKIKEFKFEQVQGWKAGEDEMFDGEEYQVGVAAYEEDTILGKKILQAKALFKNGKLEKWIYAQTGMEIK